MSGEVKKMDSIKDMAVFQDFQWAMARRLRKRRQRWLKVNSR